MARPGNNIHAKLVLLGEMGTGKTSLIMRFVKGQFFDQQEPTVGAAFFTQIISVPEATVNFDIWDTAGQERYRSLAPIYYRGAAAANVVYDISNMMKILMHHLLDPRSFEVLGVICHLKYFLLEINSTPPLVPSLFASGGELIGVDARPETFIRAKRWVKELKKQGNPNLGLALVANKSDLETDREVDTKAGERNGMFFAETSAKASLNINSKTVGQSQPFKERWNGSSQ